MEKYLFSNEKKSAPSDDIWPFKKIICQNRINKIGQIQPKCLRNYAWKWWCGILSGRKKTDKVKLWRSICLVMKIFRTVSSDVVWPFKNRFCQNRINKIRDLRKKTFMCMNSCPTSPWNAPFRGASSLLARMAYIMESGQMGVYTTFPNCFS